MVTPGFGGGTRWTAPAPGVNPEETEEDARIVLNRLDAVHCFAVVGLTEDPKFKSQFLFYRHGVEVCRYPYGGGKGVLAMIGTEGLQMDLSSHQVVRNEAYEQTRLWVAREVKELHRRLARAYPHLDPAMRLKAARLGY